MKALVTGGAGYIGSHLCRELRRDGCEVVVYDDFSTGSPENIPHDCQVVEGNIEDERGLRDTLKGNGFEIIYHLAGKILPEESVQKPDEYYRVNTIGTAKLIWEAARCGIPRFVFASTAAVYGNPTSLTISEEGNTKPVSPYGRSKLFSEGILLDAVKENLAVGILRFFNVAGIEEGRKMTWKSQPTHLISRIVDVVQGHSDQLTVFGNDYETRDGTPVRDFIHVADLALALKAVGNWLSDGNGEIFNVGYGRGYSVLEVIGAAEKVYGKPVPYQIGPRREGDISQMVSDCSKIRDNVGWSPRYQDVEEILRSCLQEVSIK